MSRRGVITARALRLTASEVRGARSLGIETDAVRQAPMLLDQARAVLARLEDRAADEHLVGGSGRAAAQYRAMLAAVRELEAALDQGQ